jgi:hypothetical protein
VDVSLSIQFHVLSQGMYKRVSQQLEYMRKNERRRDFA